MEDVWAFMGSAGEGNDDFELLQTIPMKEGIVGTDPSCEIRLRDPMLTPRHARVLKQDGSWFIGGIAVAAQTTVNGTPTIPGQAVRLSEGDLVQVGSARFRYGGEPPARHAVDASDEAAVLIWADELAEAGDPLGARILEGQQPTLPCSPDLLRDGRVVPEWKRGLLTAVKIRECSLWTLKELLADPAAVALESLTVHVATMGMGRVPEDERTRGLLQVIAATKPPSLRKLDLGWIHGRNALSGARLDWASVARRVPLRGDVASAFQRAGAPRITILKTAVGWPAVGTTVELTEPHYAFGDEDEGNGRFSHTMLFVEPTGVRISAKDLRINGLGADEDMSRGLIHGDVVESPDFALRFEES
jgi:hypothetical protein